MNPISSIDFKIVEKIMHTEDLNFIKEIEMNPEGKGISTLIITCQYMVDHVALDKSKIGDRGIDKISKHMKKASDSGQEGFMKRIGNYLMHKTIGSPITKKK